MEVSALRKELTWLGFALGSICPAAGLCLLTSLPCSAVGLCQHTIPLPPAVDPPAPLQRQADEGAPASTSSAPAGGARARKTRNAARNTTPHGLPSMMCRCVATGEQVCVA